MKTQEIEKLMTLSELRESGLTGADLTQTQIDSMREEIDGKMNAAWALGKDLATLKDKYIRQHNGTGISPENRKFRILNRYDSRDQIAAYARRDKRDELLALWDERDNCRHQDRYTQYLDMLIEAVTDLPADDLELWNRINSEYSHALAEKYIAKLKARKAAAEAAGKVC